jgi:hypothetical protein
VLPLVFPAEAVPVEVFPAEAVPVEVFPAEAVPVEVFPAVVVVVEDAALVRSLSSAVSWTDRPCWRVNRCDSSFRTSCWAWMQVVDGAVPASAGAAVQLAVGEADGEGDGDCRDGDSDGEGDGDGDCRDGDGEGDGDCEDGDGDCRDGDGEGDGVAGWIVHTVVATARSVLALVRSESIWRTVASKRF